MWANIGFIALFRDLVIFGENVHQSKKIPLIRVSNVELFPPSDTHNTVNRVQKTEFPKGGVVILPRNELSRFYLYSADKKSALVARGRFLEFSFILPARRTTTTIQISGQVKM